MQLVIVESPAKAKTIARYLEPLAKEHNDQFIVRASLGHVRDLPKRAEGAIDIENGFVPRYEIIKGKEKVLRELHTLAREASMVLLATDPDREGEAIAWHLVEVLNLPPDRYRRVVFHEITPEAIREAFRHPRALDEHLRRAQEARRVLDRIVGYDLSGLLWKKVRYGLSAGRVQSPALRLIVEREREIRAFTPTPYYILTAQLSLETGETLLATYHKEVDDPHTAHAIARTAREAGVWRVIAVHEREEARHPPPPLITSTLQQLASSRFNFSPARTMRLAQALYEAGHITYMRTDSPTLSEVAQRALGAVVRRTFGKELHQSHQFRARSAVAQEAHEAIRPTRPEVAEAGNSDDERRLYALIRARALASQMVPARVARTTITLAAGKSEPEWRATGSHIIQEGWWLADPAARGSETILPPLSPSTQLSLAELTVEEKWTQPPRRYTEAGLIRELEKRGVGRPSTYATIIETLYHRRYIERDGRSLRPTAIGEVVATFLEEHVDRYTSDTFTAEMEATLDAIARGEKRYRESLQEFYDAFAPIVREKLVAVPRVSSLGPAPYSCPQCGGPMVYKLSRNGRFMSCERFPDCEGARTDTGDAVPTGPLGEHPHTGAPIYLKAGPYGWYLEEGGPTKKKPRRVPLPPQLSPHELTLEQAVELLSFPRTLGTHPTTGEDVTIHLGRFGPYIRCGNETRSVPADESPTTFTIERALELLAQPKPQRKRTSRRATTQSSTSQSS